MELLASQCVETREWDTQNAFGISTPMPLCPTLVFYVHAGAPG